MSDLVIPVTVPNGLANSQQTSTPPGFFGNPDQILSTIPTDTTPQNMDFRQFLDFLDFASKVLNDVQDGLEKLNAFKSLIYNINECAVTGSSILAHRLEKIKEARDIDLFITGSSRNKDIIQDFFTICSRNGILNKFRDVHCEVISRSNPMAELVYKKTSNVEYQFTKASNVLETYRLSAPIPDDINFNLNFIFIQFEDAASSSDKGRNHLHAVSSSLYNSSFFSGGVAHHNKELIRSKFIPGIRSSLPTDISSALIERFPLAIPLHYIQTSFDFEELKYVYNFELQQAIPVASAAKLLLLDYKNFVISLKKNPDNKEYVEELRNLVGRLTTAISINDLRIENFLKANLGADTLTVAPVLENIRDDEALITTGHITSSLTGGLDGYATRRPIVDNQSLVMQTLFDVSKRIQKYKDKGYRIEDPTGYLGLLKTSQLFAAMSVLSDTTIDEIIFESSLLSGNVPKVRRMSLIREATKMFDELRATNNI